MGVGQDRGLEGGGILAVQLLAGVALAAVEVLLDVLDAVEGDPVEVLGQGLLVPGRREIRPAVQSCKPALLRVRDLVDPAQGPAAFQMVADVQGLIGRIAGE